MLTRNAKICHTFHKFWTVFTCDLDHMFHYKTIFTDIHIVLTLYMFESTRRHKMTNIQYIYIHWKPTWHFSDYNFVSVSMKKKCIFYEKKDSWILHSSWFQILFHFDLLFRSYESLRGLIDNSGGSRNFKTGGRGPGAVEFVGSGVCFDAPSHIPYVL